MIVTVVWFAHAACVFVLASWLRQAEYGWLATSITALTFGLAATNIETLGWTVQLITVEGMLLFLMAATWQHTRLMTTGWTPLSSSILVGLIALSTFAFARGPLVGPTLAAAILLPIATRRTATMRWGARVTLTAICLVPTVAAVLLVMKYASGNHQHLTIAAARPAALYAACYFSLSPFYKFFTDLIWTTPILIVSGAIKIGLIGAGWYIASPSQRRVLLPLLFFDLGNTALIGIGRYQEPLITATSSRYQYISLVCTLPFVGITLEWFVKKIFPTGGLRAVAATLLLVGLVCSAGRLWLTDLPKWARDRGLKGRDVIFRESNLPVEGAIPGIPFLRTQRAKELTAEFHLH